MYSSQRADSPSISVNAPFRRDFFLPSHIHKFLKLTMAMLDDVLVQVWQVMREIVWSLDHHLKSVTDDRAVMNLFDRAAHSTFHKCVQITYS